jgi:hypothetical protein
VDNNSKFSEGALGVTFIHKEASKKDCRTSPADKGVIMTILAYQETQICLQLAGVFEGLIIIILLVVK